MESTEDPKVCYFCNEPIGAGEPDHDDLCGTYACQRCVEEME